MYKVCRKGCDECVCIKAPLILQNHRIELPKDKNVDPLPATNGADLDHFQSREIYCGDIIRDPGSLVALISSVAVALALTT